MAMVAEADRTSFPPPSRWRELHLYRSRREAPKRDRCPQPAAAARPSRTGRRPGPRPAHCRVTGQIPLADGPV